MNLFWLINNITTASIYRTTHFILGYKLITHSDSSIRNKSRHSVCVFQFPVVHTLCLLSFSLTVTYQQFPRVSAYSRCNHFTFASVFVGIAPKYTFDEGSCVTSSDCFVLRNNRSWLIIISWDWREDIWSCCLRRTGILPKRGDG